MSEKYFQQPSVMSAQEHFAKAPSAMIQRSTFDRSHSLKTTFDGGFLVPVYLDEVLPGDTFNMSATSFARLATPLKPIMDNAYLDIHFWFVPYRLVWDNWQKFCGERVNPEDDPTLLTIPQAPIDLSLFTDGSKMLEYFGIPSGRSGLISVSALPFRAYELIWNEWYRDENLQASKLISTGDGPDVGYDTSFLLRRNKRHDYFTSALPWPQKGDPVLIPIAPTAPVRGIGTIGGTSWFPSGTVRETGGNDVTYVSATPTNSPAASPVVQEDPNNPGYPLIYAELGEATAVTINDLRAAFQIQSLLERDARGGTRYIELILSQFGVRSDDARLQRPEFLGGGTQRLSINPIAATATVGENPQGNLAAVGTTSLRGGFNKSFTEHGIIIGVVSARCDLTYQQGIERFWSRQTRYDFYWPPLSNLGEQPIYNKEIFVQGTPEDDEIFGYQERYAEYRYKPSRITGLFNSGVSASLDVWHYAQDFGILPGLNSTFIEEDPPFDRVIAVPAEPHFIADFWFNLKTTRPMPVYGIPGSIMGRM